MKSDTVHDFIEAWKLMTGRLPSPRFEEANGVASCFSDVPNLFFNLWIQGKPATTPEDVRAMLEVAERRAAASAHPVGGVVREDWLPAGWEVLVAEKGLAPMVPMTGMEADDLLPPRRPPADLDIRRVQDDTTARDLAVLNANAYAMPTELFDCISNMRLWHADSFGFVGYAGGKPVSSAAALPVAGAVYIALVATAPEEQGKGYAETVMRHAVEQGQRAMGVKRTTLHATDMGRPIYSAMGYASGPRMILVGPTH
jgi:GNAT superfamily N-acetyltransferase